MTPKLVVVGGSWGGFDAVCGLLSPLPADTQVPIVVALHRSPRSRDGALEHMLAECLTLEVVVVEDKSPLKPGCVHLAPADYHLLIDDGSLALSTDAVVQYSRPSIDVLFESAADEYEAAVVAVILTGNNSDGAAGISRVKSSGGTTMAQDPATAVKAQMPQAAIDTGHVDIVGTIPMLVQRLSGLLGVEARR
ncbi:MAG: chemotaxis protein CheB [Mycobacteriales bacterium]